MTAPFVSLRKAPQVIISHNHNHSHSHQTRPGPYGSPSLRVQCSCWPHCQLPVKFTFAQLRLWKLLSAGKVGTDSVHLWGWPAGMCRSFRLHNSFQGQSQGCLSSHPVTAGFFIHEEKMTRRRQTQWRQYLYLQAPHTFSLYGRTTLAHRHNFWGHAGEQDVPMRYTEEHHNAGTGDTQHTCSLRTRGDVQTLPLG